MADVTQLQLAVNENTTAVEKLIESHGSEKPTQAEIDAIASEVISTNEKIAAVLAPPAPAPAPAPEAEPEPPKPPA